MRRALLVAGVLFATLPGCRRGSSPARPAVERGEERAAERPSDDARRAAKRSQAERPPAQPASRPLERCFAGDPAGTQRPLDALLDRAADRFDAGDFAGSLACAEESARVEPRSVEAHHDRAAALEELGRLDESQAAFARALALDPDDPETLAGAAELYINHLPPSNDHSETGLEYARRGARHVKRGHVAERGLAARLALLEGQALNDLGRPRDSLARLDAAIAAAAHAGPADEASLRRIRYERAVALFELCRFEESKRGFLEVIAETPDDAWSHHHLGLVLERLGDAGGAERELAEARAVAPADFPAPVLVPPAEFRALVDEEVARLPMALRSDLALVSLETGDLPEVSDLTAEEPPLSPTILGLFRGSPLGASCRDEDEARTIVLYRKNLGRAVTSAAELRAQVRTTLLHELGHLRGEDDDELRARGLE